MPAGDIHEVKRRHAAHMLRTPGVCGFGVERDADGADVLVVHVEARTEAVASLPGEIEGYPVRVVESGPFRPLGA